MTEKNILLLLVVASFLVIVISDLLYGKVKIKHATHAYWVRLVGVYGMALLAMCLLSYLITDALRDQIIVSVVLGITSLSWFVYIERYIKHRHNYLFLLLLGIGTPLVFYMVLPRLTLHIIPVCLLSAILGSTLGTLAKIEINRGKMALVALSMIVFQLGFVLTFNDHIEASSKPMAYAVDYLHEQDMDDHYYLYISKKLYTRYDDVFITGLPEKKDMDNIRLIYRNKQVKVITED